MNSKAASKITVQEFEALKKRRDLILLERAKEEARLESLNREIASLKDALREYNVETEEDAQNLLERLSNEIALEMQSLEEAMRVYENEKASSDDV